MLKDSTMTFVASLE